MDSWLVDTLVYNCTSWHFCRFQNKVYLLLYIHKNINLYSGLFWNSIFWKTCNIWNNSLSFPKYGRCSCSTFALKFLGNVLQDRCSRSLKVIFSWAGIFHNWWVTFHFLVVVHMVVWKYIFNIFVHLDKSSPNGGIPECAKSEIVSENDSFSFIYQGHDLMLD